MMGRFGRVFSLLVGFSLTANADVFVAKYRTRGATLELFEKAMQEGRMPSSLTEEKYPAAIVEHSDTKGDMIVELRGTQAQVEAALRARKVQASKRGLPTADADDEVISIVENGPPENRIDLVFMGDGYTASERGKFIDDVKRLTREMFEGNTFKSYLPLFNVHAVFRASKESGIGINDRPKDTAYELYRVGNTLRAIMVGNSFAASSSCRAAPDCDYPILVANDPHYGGLGGQFAVTTSSVTSGSVVLRHELGHNFGRVGEEYDGGGYFGANQASSVSSVTWKHWLSGELKKEPAVGRHISWPWHNLKEGPYTAKFSSNGKFTAYDVDLSVSGMETDDDIILTMDGNPLPLKSPGHSDRFYLEVHQAVSLKAGDHNLKFETKNQDGNNMVANIKISEYGEGYHFEPNYVSVYPNYSETLKEVAFRPTHEGCLMRRMPHDKFCPVCQENQWVRFFRDVSPIDSLEAKKVGEMTVVTLDVPPLGQFREGGALEGETLSVRWFKEGVEDTSLNGKLTWEKSDVKSGEYEVEVHYKTPEVRKDTGDALKETKKLTF